MGSRTKVRILRLLCAHPEREYTLRDLSRTLGQSLGATVPAFNGLLDTRVVVTRRVGRSRTVRLNTRHGLAGALRTLFREETEALVRGAGTFAESLPPAGLKAVVLFGSAARGEASSRSDVDVLVVVDNPRLAARVQQVAASMLDRFDAAVSPLVLTEREVERRLAAFDPLLETIAAEGKLLRGRAPWLAR